ncbi:MAG: molybdopterin-dependent oxidoreductase [Desulfobacteraceae bacterium]|nr:molybdopterin-dependent oxidoreductase [Desulfobacteraceae bacterium]
MPVVKTVCNMCSTRCGINVQVEAGRIVTVAGMEEHPVHDLCLRSQAVPELVHSPERITTPLRKINGRFEEISWEDAFDLIASKLTQIKNQHGPRALLVHVGIPFVATHTQKIIRRLSDLYGTPNYTTGSSFCSLARTMSYNLTCGGHLCPDYSDDTRCMIIWGMNPEESFPSQANTILGLREKGAKLIVIDPRRTSLAKKADYHAQIRPGTDTALALGMLNVLIAEELYDKAFVDEWTVGFDKLVEHVERYTPETVEEITWVPANTVVNIARTYGAHRLASITLGISLDHSTNGIQASRAISSLVAIAGNIDIAGGNVFAPGFRQTNLRVEEKIALDKSIGADYPLFTKFTLEQTVTPAIDGMLHDEPYPIKALLAIAANPALTWPNTNKVKRVLEELEFVVVADLFMTDTAKMADIVLPGTTFLERQDLLDYRNRGFPIIVRTDKAIEPVGNSREDWKMWAELGRKMGYDGYFPWEDTDELFAYLLEEAGISLDEMKQNPGGFQYAEQRYNKYLENGFNTPSGKVEISSELMKEHGYDSLPTFIEPAESPVSQPDLAEKYPLILIAGPRTRFYYHSQYRNLSLLRKEMPEPLIEIHPETAGRAGISDGDTVKVESLRGATRIKTKFTEDIHPRVICAQHGWSEANINVLTDDENRDPTSAYPGFRSVLCRVSKAQ